MFGVGVLVVCALFIDLFLVVGVLGILGGLVGVVFGFWVLLWLFDL